MPNKEVLSVYKVVGWISIAISLLFFPIVFGTGGIVAGYLVRVKGEKTHGTIMMIVALAAIILGSLFGYIVWSMNAGY